MTENEFEKALDRNFYSNLKKNEREEKWANELDEAIKDYNIWNADAQNEIGEAYLRYGPDMKFGGPDGHTLIQEDRKDIAERHFKQAGKNGNPDAWVNLARMHSSIHGRGNSPHIAADYLKKAIANPDYTKDEAHYRMGQYYQLGLGVKENFEKAHEYYQEAAKRGSEKAARELENFKNWTHGRDRIGHFEYFNEEL